MGKLYPMSVSKVIPAWLDLFRKLTTPSRFHSPRRHRGTAAGQSSSGLLCQMLALLLQTGLNAGQEPGASPSSSAASPSSPSHFQSRRLKRSEGSHKPEATAGGRKKAQPVLFGARISSEMRKEPCPVMDGWATISSLALASPVMEEDAG